MGLRPSSEDSRLEPHMSETPQLWITAARRSSGCSQDGTTLPVTPTKAQSKTPRCRNRRPFLAATTRDNGGGSLHVDKASGFDIIPALYGRPKVDEHRLDRLRRRQLAAQRREPPKRPRWGHERVRERNSAVQCLVDRVMDHVGRIALRRTQLLENDGAFGLDKLDRPARPLIRS